MAVNHRCMYQEDHPGLIKKFSDGLWIGNSDPADASGEFKAKAGYNGMFFKFADNTAYI